VTIASQSLQKRLLKTYVLKIITGFALSQRPRAAFFYFCLYYCFFLVRGPALFSGATLSPFNQTAPFCRLVSRDIGSIPFILFSAFISAHFRRQIDATVDSWGSLSKPFDNQDVLSLIETVLNASTGCPQSTHDQNHDKTASKKF